jgi:hypothetical protein
VATQTEEPPSQVGFTLDTVPPPTPTLVTPTQGITLTGLTVTLQWTLSPDDGAPLAYDLALDGITRTVGSDTYTASVSSGSHAWRVRAVDAAGNIGPWSSEATFNVERATVFLPLLLRSYTEPVTPPPTDCEIWLTEDFEAETDWSFNTLAALVDDPIHGGAHAVRVGIPPGTPGSNSYSSIMRTLELPGDVESITLTYWAYPIAEGSDEGDFHYVGPQQDLSIDRDDAWAWEERTMDLSTYAGESVLFFFGTKNDEDEDTAALYVDDIVIEVCQ